MNQDSLHSVLCVAERVIADTTNVLNAPFITSTSDDFNFWGSMIRIMFGLLLLTVMLYLTLYFFKRLNTRIKNKNETYSFKIHENVYISQKQGLSAVTFGKKLYIIGFSNNAISLIDKIEDPEIIEAMTAENPNSARFQSIFSSFFKKRER